MTNRSHMSLILFLFGPEKLELYALEIGAFDFVYTRASTNTCINKSALNLVKMYVTIRSQMSLIMDQIRSDWAELSALE